MEPRKTLRTQSTMQPIVHPISRREFLRLTSLVTVGASLIPLKIFSKEILPLKEIKRTAYIMGSIVTFTAYHEDEWLCNIAIDEAIKEMKTIDKLMSVYDSNSQLSFVNRHSFKQEVPVDFRLIEVLEHAKKFHQLTDGAFDVTVEPLMQLYGFRDDNYLHHFPTDKQITDILDSVGLNKVTINRQLSTVNCEYEKTKLDLGGIAVGYAIDRAVNILKKHGIESALINHSGDMYALGSPPDEDFWEIGIVDPLNTEEIITTVNIKNQALSTSGNYENFVEVDGKRIGHLLNPISGSTSTSILSGTAIANNAIEADAFSTGMFVMGKKYSEQFIIGHGTIQSIGGMNEHDYVFIARF